MAGYVFGGVYLITSTLNQPPKKPTPGAPNLNPTPSKPKPAPSLM